LVTELLLCVNNFGIGDYRIFIEGLKSAVTKAAYTFAYRYGGQQQQYLPSQDYFIEHYTAMLVEEAEKLYTELVKDLTNRVVSDMAFSTFLVKTKGHTTTY
jgi:hypothetical protein